MSNEAVIKQCKSCWKLFKPGFKGQKYCDKCFRAAGKGNKTQEPKS